MLLFSAPLQAMLTLCEKILSGIFQKLLFVLVLFVQILSDASSHIGIRSFPGEFILKEKLFCFDDLSLPSAWDVKAWICFKYFQQLSDDMIDRMFARHVKRQTDIHRAYIKEGFPNVSK
jgi:hypothetical protein